MRVIDNDTQEIVGYLSDISPRGFKLDCQKSLAINQDYTLRLDLTPDISEKSYIAFVARVMWKKPDPFNPVAHIQGFQIVSISPYEKEIFQRIVDKYGSSESTI
jgi:hypothetical protein